MKINLEKACIGFFIGVLLFCVCNKMFLVEGYEAPPSTDGKIPLKPILNPSDFLSDVNKSFNDTSSNGVMVSMNVLNKNDIVNVDGSTTILRNDSSWNIWFVPCYNGNPRAHSSDYQCCNDNISNTNKICRMSVGFGWIWDPLNLPQVECAYVKDAATIYFGNPINRCDGKNPKPSVCNHNHNHNHNENDCISSMLEAAKNLNCPNNNSSCSFENEVVIMKNVGEDGQPIREISGNLVPSALVFVYDPTIFGFKGSTRNGLMLRDTFKNKDGSREKTYDALLNTLDENTYVVIMESLKLNSEYGNPQPKRIPPRFVEIVRLTELENHFK